MREVYLRLFFGMGIKIANQKIMSSIFVYEWFLLAKN